MMNNNKILTVSYGTFSCTLEGFDDSFDTMKAIAEYFRDLAADDRYFGAEPPQPDAEMLARIAEREVSRRVEAREHEGRIMLKAHEEPIAAAAAAQASETLRKQSDHETAEAAAPAPAQQEAVKPEAPVAHDAENTAPTEKENDAQVDAAEVPAAQEDRFAQDAMPEEAVATEEVQAEEVVAETQPEADAVAEITESEVTADEAEEETADAQHEPFENSATDDADDEMDAAAFFAQEPVADVFEEDDLDAAASQDAAVATEEFEAEDVAPAQVFGGASLADKLERIRAVVSSQEAQDDASDYDEDTEEPAETRGFDEIEAFDTTAEDLPGTETLDNDDVIARASRDISDAFDIDDAAEEMARDADTDEEDDLDAVLRRMTGASADEALDAPFDLGQEAQDDDIAEEDTAGNLFSAEANTDDELHDKDDREPQSRVMKVQRADLEAALASGELEEYEDEYLAEAAKLSDEEEAELQRDLAAHDEEAIDHRHEETTHPAAREKLPDIGTAAGEDVSRLMAEADHQMQEPEGKTRRSAFAHLRAAVAARFADRSIDDAEKQVQEAAEAYRNDLAEAVKPRRPATRDRSEAREEARPAPLKLVAAQRIDETQQPASRGPVAPRRIDASDIDGIADAEDTGFALYAEERGAEDLPELLEAAAAYLSFIEGHEQFSRPQLMSRVRQATSEEFSREDGLRSFGQLLRTGKIEKIKGGRFTASDAIGFKPDHRAAG